METAGVVGVAVVAGEVGREKPMPVQVGTTTGVAHAAGSRLVVAASWCSMGRRSLCGKWTAIAAP